MNKKIIYSLIGLALVFFVASLFIFIKSTKPPKETNASTPIQSGKEEPLAPTTIKVTAFFFNEQSRFMIPAVQYDLSVSGTKENCYKEFISLLLKGYENYITPVPEGVQLRTLYLIKEKELLVLDFDEQLVHTFPAGTNSELEFIYFFVDNICFNFSEIKKVKFMVSGNEYPTLSGHIDIENAFFPDYRFINEE